MSHLVAKESWGTVDLDTVKGHVFVREDWHYRWKVQMPMRPWTLPEKMHFHQVLDRQIWDLWSMRARIFPTLKPMLHSSGTAGALARHFGRTGLTLSFDVRFVHGAGQWDVVVYKLQPGGEPRADVETTTRVIQLYADDILPSGAETETGIAAERFLTVPHEFGHTIGADDEYTKGSRFLADLHSVMSVGRQIRPRHLGLICDTLGKMVGECAFRAVGS